MARRHTFDVLDKTFKDILLAVDQSAKEKVFDGFTVAREGDFMQILPIIYR